MTWQKQREAQRRRLLEKIALIEDQERSPQRDRILEDLRRSLAEVERG